MRNFDDIPEQEMEQWRTKTGRSTAELRGLYSQALASKWGFSDIAIDPISGDPIAYQTKDGKWLNSKTQAPASTSDLKLIEAQRARRQESVDNSQRISELSKALTNVQAGTTGVGGILGGGVGDVFATAKAWFGSPDMRDARKQLDRVINEQVLAMVPQLKGPLSEKELGFLQKTQIDKENSPEAWNDYLNRAINSLIALEVESRLPAEYQAGVAYSAEEMEPTAAYIAGLKKEGRISEDKALEWAADLGL
jgi:hypothetical protein